MTKRIELSLAGATAVALLHDEDAPRSAAKLWAALPIEETMRHVRWSGSAGYVLAAGLRDPSLPLENRVSFYTPRTLNFRPEHGELAISYGPAQAREPAGMAWATHVATIEGDASAFLEAVARTQHVGKQTLVITRKGS